MVQIVLGYIPILLAHVSSGVLLSRCPVTSFLAVAHALGVTRQGFPCLVATGASGVMKLGVPFGWDSGSLILVTGCPPGVAQDIQRCGTVTDSCHLRIVPPGMTINPRRSGCFCALARRECPMGIPLMVKPLTLILRLGPAWSGVDVLVLFACGVLIISYYLLSP